MLNKDDEIKELKELNRILKRENLRLSYFALSHEEYFTEKGIRLVKEYLEEFGGDSEDDETEG